MCVLEKQCLIKRPLAKNYVGKYNLELRCKAL